MDFSKPENARKINVLKTLGELRKGDLSRAEIARRLGINKVSISSIADDLSKADIVAEAGMDNSTNGRPSVKLTLSKSKGRVFSFVFSSSSITASASNLLGSSLRYERFPRGEGEEESIVSFVRKMTKDNPSVYGAAVVSDEDDSLPSVLSSLSTIKATKAEAGARAEERCDLGKCYFVSLSDSVTAAIKDEKIKAIPSFGKIRISTEDGGYLENFCSGKVLKARTGIQQLKKIAEDEGGIKEISRSFRFLALALADAVAATGADGAMLLGELSFVPDTLLAAFEGWVKELLGADVPFVLHRPERGAGSVAEGAAFLALDEFFYKTDMLSSLDAIERSDGSLPL